MKVLVINCGSSTLKFQLIDTEQVTPAVGDEARLAHGLVDRIGGASALDFTATDGQCFRETSAVPDHEKATQRVLEWLGSIGRSGPDGIDVVAHRVVHGGERFVDTTIIDEGVIAGIEEVSHLAPLHNRPALSAIRAARGSLGNGVPMVAVFDTSFHQTMPDKAARYAIPIDLAQKHHIRRYGFHGIAHRYMAERYAAITSTPLDRAKVITLQLGNGCSAAAVAGGRSVDTSMGFTPLEGLMMGTRSGDIDPSVVSFLAHSEAVDAEEVEGWLNSRSGLLGVSGFSSDMRELLEAEAQGNSKAALAVDMFCYRVRKCIGAYLAALGGADAVAFGGGIGERSPAIRARICADMDWCGLSLDGGLNDSVVGSEERISSSDAAVRVYVIPVDEAAVMAQEAARCLIGIAS